MRNRIAGLAALVAVSVSAVSASACGVSPCGGYGYGGYGGYSQGYSYGYSPNYSQSYSQGYGCCGGSYGASSYDRLPDQTGPQYYYVNQGPTYAGPGRLAPAPSYQERAVSGFQSYSRPYYYGYNGGPYGNATSHYYDGAPDISGPAIYSYRAPPAYRSHYRPNRRPASYYYTGRSNMRYGYSARRHQFARDHYGVRKWRPYPLRSLN